MRISEIFTYVDKNWKNTLIDVQQLVQSHVSMVTVTNGAYRQVGFTKRLIPTEIYLGDYQMSSV